MSRIFGVYLSERGPRHDERLRYDVFSSIVLHTGRQEFGMKLRLETRGRDVENGGECEREWLDRDSRDWRTQRLEKAMEDYEMKNVLYDLGKASSFKAEQKPWFHGAPSRNVLRGTEKMSATKESTVEAIVDDESRKVGDSYDSQGLEFVCSFGNWISTFRGVSLGLDRRSCKYWTSHRSSSKAQGSLGSASRSTVRSWDGKSKSVETCESTCKSRVGWWSVTTGERIHGGRRGWGWVDESVFVRSVRERSARIFSDTVASNTVVFRFHS